MLLHEYCSRVRSAIGNFENYGFAEYVNFREEIRAGKQVILDIEIRVINGSMLFIREYVDAKYRIERLRYAYQYHNKNGELIFRYDNAAHKPLPGFKEHKHLSDGKIIHSSPPDIFDLLDEVITYL